MKLDGFSPENLNLCRRAIEDVPHRPVLAGITGEACSGKTHFSTLLRQQFGHAAIPAVYFSYDDFLVSRADREKLRALTYSEGPFAGRSHWEVLENWYRLDEFDAAITALSAGRPFTFLPYQRSTGEVSAEAITLPPAPFVLIDTGMALDRMDILIMVTADPGVILERKRSRGVYRSLDEIIEIHERVQAFHWSRVRPSQVDIEITNNDSQATTT